MAAGQVRPKPGWELHAHILKLRWVFPTIVQAARRFV
jgi:hypothetical protein